MRISIRKDRTDVVRIWNAARKCVYCPQRNHMNDPNIEYTHVYIWHYQINYILYFGYVYKLSDIIPVTDDSLIYGDEVWVDLNSVHTVIQDCF